MNAFIMSFCSEEIPDTVEKAQQSKVWQHAMDDKMKELTKIICGNSAGYLPEKTVGCRWIYTIKYKLDGYIERYKVRLIAKGYTLMYEID